MPGPNPLQGKMENLVDGNLQLVGSSLCLSSMGSTGQQHGSLHGESKCANKTGTGDNPTAIFHTSYKLEDYKSNLYLPPHKGMHPSGAPQLEQRSMCSLLAG